MYVIENVQNQFLREEKCVYTISWPYFICCRYKYVIFFNWTTVKRDCEVKEMPHWQRNLWRCWTAAEVSGRRTPCYKHLRRRRPLLISETFFLLTCHERKLGNELSGRSCHFAGKYYEDEIFVIVLLKYTCVKGKG